MHVFKKATAVALAAGLTLTAIAAAPASAHNATQTAASSAALSSKMTVTTLSDEAPATYQVTRVSASSALAVRQGPGTHEMVVASLAPSATVQTTGKRASVNGAEWRQVTVGSVTGWSSAYYLTKVPAAPTGPAVTFLADEASATYVVSGVSSWSALAVRQGPGTHEMVVASLAPSATVQTTGKRASVNGVEWRQVTVGSVTGWSSAHYLKKAPAAPTVPVVVALADEAPAAYRVTGVASWSHLRVRQGAGTHEAIVAKLAPGVVVQTTGKRASVNGSEWRQVTVGSVTGWSSAQFLAKTT